MNFPVTNRSIALVCSLERFYDSKIRNNGKHVENLCVFVRKRVLFVNIGRRKMYDEVFGSFTYLFYYSQNSHFHFHSPVLSQSTLSSTKI